MEAFFAQYPVVPMVLLMAAYELAKFLGKQGWNWLTGVASKSVTTDLCEKCKQGFQVDLQLGDARFALLNRAVAFLLQATLALCKAKDLDCGELEHKSAELIDALVSTGQAREGTRR